MDCGWQNNDLSKTHLSQLLEPVRVLCYLGKFADGNKTASKAPNKAANHLILSWRDYSVLCDSAQCNYRSPYK